MVNISTENLPWNKIDKTPNFSGILPHVTILTILEAIRTSQDVMADGLSGNIFADLRKRVTFGGFSEERMQSLLEGIWNKVECALKDLQKAAGQLEEFYDSKGM